MNFMKVQKFFRENGPKITLLAAILIVLGLGAKYLGGENLLLTSNILLAVASVVAGLPILLRAISALQAKVISIELLVSIAVIGAFIIGEYNESAIVTFLFLFGDYLEQKTLAKTRSSIKSLAAMAPTTALVLQEDGSAVETDVDDVEVKDRILVKPGAQTPVDGVVIEGHGYLDEAAITGESRAVKKEVGDSVFSGAVLSNGFLTVEATKVGEDTTFAKILELVEDAQDTKSKAEKFIDKFAKYYTPAVLVIALLVFIFSRDVKLAITVLVLGCPGALVIGAPVSNVAGIGNGAKNGILVKGASVMDEFAKIETFVFDKTGTLTTGKTVVSAFTNYAGKTDTEKTDLLARIAKAESLSDHPLGNAIINYVDDKEIGYKNLVIAKNKAIKGQGLEVDFGDATIFLGNEKLLAGQNIIPTDVQQREIERIKQTGSSIVIVTDLHQVLAVIGISDQIRPEAKENLAALKSAGAKKLVMLTGDNAVTAQYVATKLGIDEVRANLLPDEKAKIIKELQDKGEKVAFIGDGINDSPSLATADIGISMGSGTDVAIETSDVVLMQSSIRQLAYAYQLSKKTVLNTRENIIISIVVVAFLLLGLIAGFIYMASGMFVHEASILVVILNAMRLLRFKPKFLTSDKNFEEKTNNAKLDSNQVFSKVNSI